MFKKIQSLHHSHLSTCFSPEGGCSSQSEELNRAFVFGCYVSILCDIAISYLLKSYYSIDRSLKLITKSGTAFSTEEPWQVRNPAPNTEQSCEANGSNSQIPDRNFIRPNRPHPPTSYLNLFKGCAKQNCQKKWEHKRTRKLVQVLLQNGVLFRFWERPQKITLTNLTSEVYTVSATDTEKPWKKSRYLQWLHSNKRAETMKNTNITLESSRATTSSFHFKSYHETLDGSKLNEIPTTRGNCGLGVQVGCHLFPQWFSENNMTVPLGLSLMPHDMRLNWRFLQAKSWKSARSDVETAFDSMLT